MVFSDPFNNISVSFIVANHWQTLSHNVVSSTPKEEFVIISVILVVRLKFVVR